MKRITFILFLLIPAAYFAQNTWEKKAAFDGDKRSRGIGFSIGNRGYIGLGEDTANIERTDFWEYDPGTDCWTQRATLPATGRRDAVGFAIGNKGYVGTGIDAPDSWTGNNLSDFWEYNPVTNTWLQRTACPSGAGWGGIYFACGFSVNGMGYVLGGKLGASSYSNELWQFNPTTNSWVQRASFPAASRYSMSAFVISGKVYAGLGTDENILQNDWWEYNPTLNSWLQKASFPGSGRFAAFGFAIGQKGYIVCGSDGGYKDELWQYDIASNTWWVKAPYGGGARRSTAGFVIANAAYVGTGSGYTGARRDFWQYEQYITGTEEIEVTAPGIFPNPVQNNFVITAPSGVQFFPENALMSIIAADGKIVQRADVSSQSQVDVDASGFAAGTYIVQISTDTWHSQATFIKK